jgi:SAM-dependent methyltransferase
VTAETSAPSQDGAPILSLRGGEALQRLIARHDVHTVLDVGSGSGDHAKALRAAGRFVTTISLVEPADYVGDFMSWPSSNVYFDALWACHVLEHQVDPGAFLRECRRRLRPNGYLVITVPPAKREIVGGHVTLWNAGLLLYHLILAGFDCSKARVGNYGYNLSVIVRNDPADISGLVNDHGDIDRIAKYFPIPVKHGFDGDLPNIRWADENDPKPERPIPPTHVAILGLGSSLNDYVEVTKRIGGRHRLCDEVWVINAAGGVLQCDRIIHMDDVIIQEIRAKALPDSNIGVMLEWMRKHPGPIYTSRAECVPPVRADYSTDESFAAGVKAHDEFIAEVTEVLGRHPAEIYASYPGLVALPLQDVINSVHLDYFNSSAAHAVALAIHLGVKKLSIYAMTSPTRIRIRRNAAGPVSSSFSASPWSAASKSALGSTRRCSMRASPRATGSMATTLNCHWSIAARMARPS